MFTNYILTEGSENLYYFSNDNESDFNLDDAERAQPRIDRPGNALRLREKLNLNSSFLNFCMNSVYILFAIIKKKITLLLLLLLLSPLFV